MTGDCRHFAVRMPIAMCTDYLTRTLGIRSTALWNSTPGATARANLPIAWRGMMAISAINCAWPHHDGPPPGAGPIWPVAHRIAAGALLQFLFRADCPARQRHFPRHVRRARDIIHASRDDTISIADLAQRVGVSVRSLQNGFRQFWASRRWNMSAATGWNNCTAR
jgi:lambda repressor-like predicted transcriptional regulator